MHIKSDIKGSLINLFNDPRNYEIAEKEALDRLRAMVAKDPTNTGKRAKVPFVLDRFVSRLGRVTVVYLSAEFDFEED